MKLVFRTGYNLNRRLGLFLCANKNIQCSYFSSAVTEKMKFLNVAEKNDAAKNIAMHLSRGTSRRVNNLNNKNKNEKFCETTIFFL